MNTAMLLIGPTGAGKTPLGQMLECEGLGGRRCVHVDFGQLLRLAAGQGGQPLSQDERALIRRVLDCGALLEDEHFALARKLVDERLASAELDAGDVVVLNGLPRHVGQARDVDAMLDITTVVDLTCDAETVFDRIAANAGGDRTARTDDHAGAIRDKLALYAARTRPLIDHYRRAGARIIALDIGPATTAQQAWQALDHATQQLPGQTPQAPS